MLEALLTRDCLNQLLTLPFASKSKDYLKQFSKDGAKQLNQGLLKKNKIKDCLKQLKFRLPEAVQVTDFLNQLKFKMLAAFKT